LPNLRFYPGICLEVVRIVTKIGYPVPRLVLELATSQIQSSVHFTATFSNMISVLCLLTGRLELKARTEN
jgi:hypothetical protein